MPKIRNIIIFVAIAAALVLAYIFFVKPSFNSQATLVSSAGTTATDATVNTNVGSGTSVAQGFLDLLLSVRTIKLDVSIFSDPAFASLHDSSVTLTPDVTIGRPDPFAQFGADAVAPATTTTPTTTNSTITTPTIPPASTAPVSTTPATH